MFNGRGLGEESSVRTPDSPREEQASEQHPNIREEQPSPKQQQIPHQQFMGQCSPKLTRLLRTQQQIVQLTVAENKHRALLCQLAMERRQLERELAWTKYQQSTDFKEQSQGGSPLRSPLGVRSPDRTKNDSSSHKRRRPRELRN